MKKFFYVSLILFFLLSFASCQKRNSIEINSSSLEIAPDLQWALIVVPYAAFRADSSFSSQVQGSARKGEIFVVKGKKSIREESNGDENSLDRTVWYNFEQGWLDESLVRIYDTKLKAQNAAKRIQN